MFTAGLTHAYDMESWPVYGLISALATFSVYNLQRAAKISYAYDNAWMNWVKKHVVWIIFLSILAILSAGITLIFGIGLNIEWAVLHLPFLFIVFFYVYRIGKKNLREIPFLKIVWIAVTWLYVLYIFPLLNEGIVPHASLSLGLFLYVIAVTIPFDIRDIKLDKPDQKTIPQLLGIKGAKVFALILLFLSFILFNQQWSELWINPFYHVVLIVHAMILIGVNKDSGDLYVAGIVDGMISFLGLLFFTL